VSRAGKEGLFARHMHIVSAARPVFVKPADEGYLTGLEKEAFSERAAYYLGEINALHHFREGNGRAQREFINHLAYKNGFSIFHRVG
jgi:cell filamentation protein